MSNLRVWLNFRLLQLKVYHDKVTKTFAFACSVIQLICLRATLVSSLSSNMWTRWDSEKCVYFSPASIRHNTAPRNKAILQNSE